jgi:hypothetical protein
MDNNNLKYLLASVAGWLMVQVSGVARETVFQVIDILPGNQRGIAEMLGLLVAGVGWIVTVIFAVPVILSAWKSLRRK